MLLDDFSHLNPQQRQAVTAGLGQILVLAGPGSGKTRVLTERATFLVNSLGVRGYKILAVTFTNKASREMQTRLEKRLGEGAEQIWLGTFHSICARLLRREAEALPFTSSFVIMDSDDQESIVKRALKELNINDKLYRPGSIHAAISNAKNSMILPKDYPVRNYRDEIVARVYERYQELLLNNNSVDFDDLLLWSVRLLEENQVVREKYARRFEHVLVDEFQDTNAPQYLLLALLSSYHHNLFVVGDEDQSIYRWRGADYKNVLRFEQDFPEAQKVLLEQNYRSTQTVLDAARAVIDRNPYRTPKRLFTERGKGESIRLYEAFDDHAEAAYVVDTIRQAVDKNRQAGGEFAIMYRTNAQSRLLEEAFLQNGMPYRLVGAQRFYGRREVKDLIAFLRLVANPVDEISLGRVINIPPRGIGDKTLLALQLTARAANVTPGEVLLDLGRTGDKSIYWKEIGRPGAVLNDFGALLVGWCEQARKASLPALFDQILADTGYQAYIQDDSEESEDRWGNVQELRKLAYEFQERGLYEFLENLALVSDQDTLPEEINVPTLLTLHAAKGLEFGQVFITGLDEGLLPHSRAVDDPEEMAEERRLFYVGMTRARNRLYLVRARQRTSYGSFDTSQPSRFIRDIPEELILQNGLRSSGSQREKLSRWDDDKSRYGPSTTRLAPSSGPDVRWGQPAPVQKDYEPGMRVRHPIWGEGMVLESRILDDEETLDVAFESVGFKRLIASLAKLEKIT
jgi:DNA helicase II / ATP-dependent DNA helicase PcrA